MSERARGFESHPLRQHSTFVSFGGEAGLQPRALAFGIALAGSNPTLSASLRLGRRIAPAKSFKRALYSRRSVQTSTRHYTGLTSDLNQRLYWHNAGQTVDSPRPSLDPVCRVSLQRRAHCAALREILMSRPNVREASLRRSRGAWRVTIACSDDGCGRDSGRILATEARTGLGK